MLPKVLFVDDDPNILAAFKRRLRETFKIDTAIGAAEALSLIDEKGGYPVVVSDLRMPGMDGMQFLRQVKKKNPNSICIILTAYAELQIAIDAVNEGLLFRFLVKPCKPEVLTHTIAEGLDLYSKKIDGEEKLLKDTQAKQQFKKLVSPDLAELVSLGQLKVEKGGRKMTATVMFADICGFTSLSETTQATEVLELLNEYFEMIVDIVLEYGGTLDKFIGDEMMVIWGAPVKHDNDPERAVRAALDIQDALVRFNALRESAGQETIQAAIGINTGELVAGYVGSTHTMNYSVIGDTVNVASRLCSSASAGKIIISQDTFLHVEPLFKAQKLELIQVKGKSQPIQAYNILACA